MRREEHFEYQDDAVSPSAAGQQEEDIERQKAVAEEVDEVLRMPGYMYLHQLFTSLIMDADERLRSFSLSEPQLRYEQGRLAAALYIQNTFVEMAKVKPKEEEHDNR